MGSVGDDEQTITVLITGFAPFKKDYPVNPSWEIARSLPTHLPPLRAKVPPSTTTTTTNSNNTRPTLPPVRLLVHPAPIRVNYTTVRDLVPQLWDLDGTSYPDRPKIDLAIHVGMAGPRLFYSIERRGHRDGYVMGGVDGEVLEGGTSAEWEGMPGALESDFDLGDVLGRWRGYSPKHLDLRISEDAGHYLCDFIYFSSLAHLEKAGERRNVLFLHVPSDASEHSIATGRELLLQLVRSVVESEMVRREKGEAEGVS